MATTALVDRDLDVGRRIIGVLARAGIPVTIAFWAHVPQIDEWQFFIATPLVDSKGPRSAYEQVLKSLRNDEGIEAELPWRRIFLRSPKDPTLRMLEKQSRIVQHDQFSVVNAPIAGNFIEDVYVYGSAIIIESKNIPGGSPSAYYVTYAPYLGSGDPTWIVTGLDHLKQLLSRLHLNQNVVESVVEELSAKKKAFIPNVRLRAQDLKRLRPA